MPAMAPSPDGDPDELQMSFGEHLEELRRRLIYAILGIVAACCITLWYGRSIYDWLCEPLYVVQYLYGLPRQAYTRSVITGFTVYLKVSLIAGAILAMPWVVYQLWKFISAGLYASERKAAIVIAPLSAVMSVLGVLFMYYIFLPASLVFLVSWTTTYPARREAPSPTLLWVTGKFVDVNNATMFAATTAPGATNETQPAPRDVPINVPMLDDDPEKPAEGQLWFNRTLGELRFFQGGRMSMITSMPATPMAPLLDPSDYVDEVAILGLIVVGVFQIPVVMMLLAGIGLVNPHWLGRYRKAVVMVCIIGAVILTPSQDIFSNVALPAVMYALFEFGLILMKIAWKYRGAPEADIDA